MPESPPKDWKKSRSLRVLQTSPSQHEVFALCKRKWWLGSVRKLPRPVTTSQAFGTVLHSVCERFLTADDMGRDPKTGKPVDLYPDGWHKAINRYGQSEGEVTLKEQGLIKALVQAAIESGILERVEGRRIEGDFRLKLAEIKCTACSGSGRKHPDNPVSPACPECKGEGNRIEIFTAGFIDLMVPEGIQDHKTTSSPRWIKSADPKSPNYLGKNIQMVVYAMQFLRQYRERTGKMPDRVLMRHNAYVKDFEAPIVRKVEVWETPENIMSRYAEIAEQGIGMAQLRSVADSWSDLPEPASRAKACNAYGGCEFLSICSGRESEKQYEIRMNRHVAGLDPSGDSPMSVKDLLAKIQRSNQGGTATAPAPAAANPLNPPPPAAAPEPPKPTATAALGALSKLAGVSAAAKAAPAAPAPVVPSPIANKPSAPAPAVPSASDAETTAPPWAWCDCTACQGLGFNSKGIPCRICDTVARRDKRPASSDFDIQALGDGTVAWVLRSDDSVSGVSPLPSTGDAPAPPPPVKAQERQMPPEQPQDGQDDVLEGETDDEGAEAPDAAQATQQPQKRGRGRPRKDGSAPAPTQAAAPAPDKGLATDLTPGPGRPARAFSLCVNCFPIKTSDKIVRLEDVLHLLGQQMAKEAGVESFYDLDAFRRRDALAKAGASVAEILNTQYDYPMVVAWCGTGQGDLRSLLDAISPHAGLVIRAEG